MDILDLLRALAALGLVLALIVGGYWLLKRSGLRIAGAPVGGTRLGVVEVRALDTRRKLVLIRRDDKEHLLLLGATGEIVVETGIAAPTPQTGGPA